MLSEEVQSWHYPPGTQVWDVIDDPATPSQALLQLPVLKYVTLEAYARAATPAARTPEVLSRTVALLASADSLAWYDRLEISSGAGKEHIADLLLQHEELSLEDLKNIVPYTDPALSGAALASHPNCTPAVLVMLILHVCEWRAGGVARLTSPRFPASVRILSAVAAASAVNSRAVPRADSRLLHEALERLGNLPGAPDMLEGLYPEWYGRPVELVNLVERLCS